jgi:hypothetical protein
MCKHTILATPPVVTSDGSIKDELLYFDVVERQRTSPFWSVPNNAVRRAENRNKGKLDAPSVLVATQASIDNNDDVDPSFDLDAEFGGGFDDDRGTMVRRIEAEEGYLWTELEC